MSFSKIFFFSSVCNLYLLLTFNYIMHPAKYVQKEPKKMNFDRTRQNEYTKMRMVMFSISLNFYESMAVIFYSFFLLVQTLSRVEITNFNLSPLSTLLQCHVKLTTPVILLTFEELVISLHGFRFSMPRSVFYRQCQIFIVTPVNQMISDKQLHFSFLC